MRVTKGPCVSFFGDLLNMDWPVSGLLPHHQNVGCFVDQPFSSNCALIFSMHCVFMISGLQPWSSEPTVLYILDVSLHTPDSNEWVVIKLCRSLITTHSFESGVMEQEILIKQDRGALRTRVEEQI